MTQTFRTLGGVGPDPFAPKKRTLPSADILRVLSWDPNHSMDHGRLRAIHHRLNSVRGTDVPTPEQNLLEWTLTVQPKRVEPESYDNPARLQDAQRERRALTPGDLEFVRTFEGAEPSKVPAEDVRLLAQLEATAQDESERRVVARVLGPIRRHHDRKDEEAQLRNTIAEHKSSGYRCSVIADAWVPVLAERLAEENRAELEPPLAGLPAHVREKKLRPVERDAEREARDRVSGLWRQLDGEAAEKVNAAQARLSALTLGADPETSAIRTSETSSMEEGRRRGREHREAREARADAFADFRTIG